MGDKTTALYMDSTLGCTAFGGLVVSVLATGPTGHPVAASSPRALDFYG
jgi:hypothetical protein